MEGQVQVDFPSFYEEYNEYRPALMEPYVSTGNTTKSPCMCPACIGGAKDQERQILRVDRYDSIIPEANKELTKHHYFLCPQSVWAYMFKARDWRKPKSAYGLAHTDCANRAPGRPESE